MTLPLRPRRLSVVSLLAVAKASLVGTVLVAGVLAASATTAAAGNTPASASSSNAAADEQLWTCGMHPQVIQDRPGSCPICGMQLVPLTIGTGADNGEGDAEDAHEGRAAVTIDPAVVQNMGVRMAVAERRRLVRTLRATGFVEEWQPGIHDVTLRVSGWITRLYADTEGMMVTAGDPLLDLYSPALRVAVGELIAARRASDGRAEARSEARYQGAREKLALYGLDEPGIDALARLDAAPVTVTFHAPSTGHITHKEVVAGSAIEAGKHLLRIVDHSTLWIDARLPESQLALVQVGQKARAHLLGAPKRHVEGELIFIHPHIEPETRTGLVRLEVPNSDMTLRPGMYATVEIEAVIADDAVAVPREAVIDSGTRQIVFIAEGNGRFEPREVRIGAMDRTGMVEVRDGLAEGETVVTSGQFLLDAESRMREALAKFLAIRRQGRTNTAAPAAAVVPHVH